MKEPLGSVKRARDGGYVHVLVEGASHRSVRPAPVNPKGKSESGGQIGEERISLAPLEIRNAAYQKLLDLSPAWKYERELVTSRPDGLLARGLLPEDVARFGALPPKRKERDELARKINSFIEERFPQYMQGSGNRGVIGVPGFWGIQ
jgi:hypothetical protein